MITLNADDYVEEWFSDCQKPTSINASILAMSGSQGFDDNGIEVTVSGGSVLVECDFELYMLTTDNGTMFRQAVTLTCDSAQWNDADSGWMCVPAG